MQLRTGETLFLAVALCTSMALAAGRANAQAPAPTPDARAILLKMGEFLGKTERLSTKVLTAYDTVQASGDKVEWNEVRTLTLRRPDRLRMEAEKSNGARSLVIFDGKQITTYDEAGRVYAQAAQAGGIDETLVYFVRDLGMRLPLAVFFLSRAASELGRRVLSVRYIEKTGILGAPAHHLAGRTDTVNFQIWIADGDQPVPQRIVLTYPSAPGQPQFRAHFTAWNLAPDVADASFAFAPPADTSRIPFAAALPRYGSTTPRAATKKEAK